MLGSNLIIEEGVALIADNHEHLHRPLHVSNRIKKRALANKTSLMSEIALARQPCASLLTAALIEQTVTAAAETDKAL